MTTTLTRREQIVASLNDKIYRDAFLADQIRIGVPFQSRAMRDDLSQEVLGTMMSPPMKLHVDVEAKHPGVETDCPPTSQTMYRTLTSPS